MTHQSQDQIERAKELLAELQAELQKVLDAMPNTGKEVFVWYDTVNDYYYLPSCYRPNTPPMPSAYHLQPPRCILLHGFLEEVDE